MYNIYLISFYADEEHLGAHACLADAIAHAERTMKERNLQNGEIVDVVGVDWTGEPDVIWSHRAPDPSDRWSTVSIVEY